MSEITPELVRHLAGLARIEVSDAEVAQFTSQLALIVDSVATIKAAVSDDVPATSHPIPMANVFREDTVKPSLTQQQALSGAADSESAVSRSQRFWTRSNRRVASKQISQRTGCHAELQRSFLGRANKGSAG